MVEARGDANTPPAPAGAAELRRAVQDLRIALTLNTHRVAAIAGLKDSDLDVLDVLTREGSQSPTALARRMSIQPATMTGVLRRLEDANWVTRRHCTRDRRSVEIESLGFERLADIYRDGSDRLDTLQTQMPLEEVATVLDYLRSACAAVTDASAALVDSRSPQPTTARMGQES